MYLEIYDECSFTMDELIAWAQIPIPQTVLQGQTVEEWYPLNGKQGDGQEGMISLVLSYSKVAVNPYGGYYAGGTMAPVVMVPSTASPIYGMRPYTPVPVYTQPAPPPVQLNEADLKQVEEMFPNMDKEVVKSVYEANRGNKDATANSLLQMCE